MNPGESENTETLDTNLTFDPKFTTELINTTQDKVKYDLTIGPSNVTERTIAETNRIPNQYTYEELISGRSLSNKIPETGTVRMRIESQTFRDPTYYTGSPWVKNIAASANSNGIDASNGSWRWSYMGGMGRKYLPGVMGFKPLPLTSSKTSVDVTLGGQVYSYNIDDSIIDATLRMVERDELLKQQNHLSPCLPDNCRYYSENSTSQPYLRDTLYRGANIPNGLQNGAVEDRDIDGTIVKAVDTSLSVGNVVVGMGRVYRNFKDNLQWVCGNPGNVLGTHYSGRYVKPKTVTFYSKANPNTPLPQIVVDGIEFPQRTITETGKNTIWFSSDVTGKPALIEEYTFEFTEPIMHHLLSQYTNPLYINYSEQIRIANNLRGDMENIVVCAYDYEPFTLFTGVFNNYANYADTAQQTPSTYESAIVQDAYPTPATNQMTISVSTENCSCQFTETQLQPEIIKAKKCVIPFMEIDSSLRTQNTVIGNWNSIQSDIQINFPPKQFTKYPTGVLLWVEDYNKMTDMKRKYRTGQTKGRVTKVQVQFGAHPAVCNTYSEAELFNRSKRNGLKQYEWADVVGKTKFTNKHNPPVETLMVKPPNMVNPTGEAFYTVSQIRPAGWELANNTGFYFYPDQDSDFSQTLEHVEGLGTYVYLKFGIDIPLPPDVAPGVTKTDTMNISVWVSKREGWDSTYCQARALLFTEKTFEMANNTSALKENVFTREDVQKAYKVLQNRSSEPVSAYYLMGGGFFGNTFSKIRSIIPKIPRMIQSAKQTYDDVRDPMREIRQGMEKIDHPATRASADLFRSIGFGGY